MSLIVGTCSLCRGPVTKPTVWYSTIPPLPVCGRCGAEPMSPYGPVIEMQPARPSIGGSESES